MFPLLSKLKRDNLTFLGLALVMLCTMMLLCTGCSSSQMSNGMGNTQRYVVDAEGTRVAVPEKAKRILTLSLGFDVMTLGVVPPERMVAVHRNSSDPGISYIVEESKDIKPKLYLYPFETILKLEPDLIIASTWTKPEMIQGYRDLGFNVIVCKGPNTVEKVKETITLIAQAVGEEAAGQRVIEEMDRQLQEIDSTLDKRKAKWPTGMLVSQMTSYGGKGCMFDELCTKAHVVNGIVKMGLYNGQYVPKELVVGCDPDFFMVSAPRSQSTAASRKHMREYLQDNALKGMKALEHVTPIPDRYLYSASQNCVYAIKGIANAAYGPVFDMREEKLIKGY